MVMIFANNCHGILSLLHDKYVKHVKYLPSHRLSASLLLLFCHSTALHLMVLENNGYGVKEQLL
jgi:hypothetical protein